MRDRPLLHQPGFRGHGPLLVDHDQRLHFHFNG